MTATSTDLHPNHVVIVTPVELGKCSFYSGDWDAAPFFALVDHQCGQPVEYIATGSEGGDAGLCRVHAAHIRACPKCSAYLSVLRNLAADELALTEGDRP